MIRRPLTVAVTFLAVGALTTPAFGASAGWRTYKNPRWEFRIDVPKSLVAQPEPQNGGGLEWKSPDGKVRLIAYGEFDQSEDDLVSIADTQNDHEWNWIESEGRITFRKTTSSWFVSSGISKSGRIFYERYEQVIARDHTCHMAFTISYPQSLRSTWNPKTERIAKSFKVPKGICDE